MQKGNLISVPPLPNIEMFSKETLEEQLERLERYLNELCSQIDVTSNPKF